MIVVLSWNMEIFLKLGLSDSLDPGNNWAQDPLNADDPTRPVSASQSRKPR